MNKLIVAEKPSVALRIAIALGGNPRTNYFNGIRYYEFQVAGDNVYVVAAAGHLFTIRAKSEGTIPLFDVEWIASYRVNQESYYTKKYLDAIESIAKKCQSYINACDYDIEGTVIGTNIISFVTGGDVNKELKSSNVLRMKFSTTTTPDLLNSYAHLEPFDKGNFQAGETRHMLDWFWGINMSRALMRAIRQKGVKKTLSIGRVQGPTLGILAKRELDIKNFIPKPFWRVAVNAKGTDFDNTKGEIFDKAVAQQAFEKTKNGTAVVKSVDASERPLYPFPPFDLTSLQLEANRVHRIDPTRTLQIAQTLYERSYISYPRTSSQKLPATLNLPRIIGLMAKIDKYSKLAEKLTAEQRFHPIEGSKADEAHPAIYPTGENPAKLSEDEEKVYDLVARRFLSCFAEKALLDETKVMLNVDGEQYYAKGDVIKSPGWLDYYLHYKPKTNIMPHFTTGETVSPIKPELKELKTQPPKRYTKASLISLLESKDLGTKATRTEVIDTLFRREYIKGMSIEVTSFGLSVYNALSKYCSEIIDEDMTRKLEKDMEEITVGKNKEENVIKEGKELITKIITEFTTNEASIGDELMKGMQDSELQSSLGKCPKCGNGNLILRRSKAGKNFIGCTAWPKCTNTYSVPQVGRIVPTGKICEKCHTPKIKVFRPDKKVFEMCLDPACPTKADWASKLPREKTDGGATVAVKSTSPPGAPAPRPIATTAKSVAKPTAKPVVMVVKAESSAASPVAAIVQKPTTNEKTSKTAKKKPKAKTAVKKTKKPAEKSADGA